MFDVLLSDRVDATPARSAPAEVDVVAEAELTADALERAVVEAATVVHAAEARFARLLARFAVSGGVGATGSRSLAHWVSWRCGFAMGDARRRAVLAERLADLPVLAAAMDRGRVGVSVAAGVAVVATPVTERELVEVASSAAPAQAARVVGSYRRARVAVEADAVEAEVAAGVVEGVEGRRERRWARWHVADDGTFALHAELPAVEGALVARAFEAAGDRLRRSSGSSEAAGSAPARVAGSAGGCGPSPAGAVAEVGGADALVELARHLLGCDRDVASVADRYVVQVHVDLEALADPEGVRTAVLDDGIPVEPAAVRRLLCLSAVQAVVERDGQVLNVGRRSRFATARQRPALARRDGGCVFPGCPVPARWCEAHHAALPWVNGGRTDLDDLVLVCRAHHHLVHDRGWTMERAGPGGRFRFRRPDGQVLVAHVDHPPPEGRLPVPDDLGEGAAAPWAGQRLDVHTLDALVAYLLGLDATALTAAAPSTVPDGGGDGDLGAGMAGAAGGRAPYR